MMRCLKSWFVVGTMGLLLGCQTEADVQNESPPDAAKLVVVQAEPGSTDVRVVNALQFRDEIAALKGQVVLVDMWATW